MRHASGLATGLAHAIAITNATTTGAAPTLGAMPCPGLQPWTGCAGARMQHKHCTTSLCGCVPDSGLAAVGREASAAGRVLELVSHMLRLTQRRVRKQAACVARVRGLLTAALTPPQGSVRQCGC